MSHKMYRNLAHLDDLGTDLNYTGIILDNWEHPANLFPVVTAIVLLFMGIPRSGLALWTLFNACIIHAWFEGMIGLYGIGWKYMVDEYAILDSRFWATRDPAVTVIAILELYIMYPLSIIWYYSIVKDKWYQHFYGILLSAIHATGAVIYVGAEILEDYKHLPDDDTFFPPKFNSYLALKYFWIIFWFLNILWIIIPVYVIYVSYAHIREAFLVLQNKKAL